MTARFIAPVVLALAVAATALGAPTVGPLTGARAYLAAAQLCGLLSIWAQGMALLGGIMAFQRMNWKLTVVCAIFSLATLGFFFVEGSLVGFLALILTIRARPYFVS